MITVVMTGKRMLNVKYLILFTLIAGNLLDQPAPEVTIEQGTLSGVISSDGTTFEYLGIPYATTNSSTRFQAPLAPPSWKGLFKANEDIYLCPQTSRIFGVIGSEDCLRMNIYVPALTKGPFPVMFSIHGGAFILGSGGKLLYGPEFLIRQDVILVTFNYRIGPLGFLCLGTKEVPGNAGLKDQLAALRWVKKNIAAFGGDPDNITAFGQSAGGASVSILLASDATRGLFKRAIVQSGSSTANWAINSKPLWSASLLANALGYNTENPDKLYEIFSKVSYKDLTKARVEKPWELYTETPLINTPCIEKSLPGLEPIITDLPYNILSKNPRDIPIIFGTTSREGLFFLQFETEALLERKNNMYLFSDDLKFESKAEAEAVSENLKRFYFGRQKISNKVIMNVSEVNTHLFFEMPAIFETESYLSNTKSNIFNYYFNYSGGRNFLKVLFGHINEPGSSHGDELLYLFKGRIWPYWITKRDQKIIDYMTKMWANFAKYGHPTPESATDLPVKWLPSHKDEIKFMYIEDTLKMGPMPNPAAYELWRQIYTKHRKK